MWGRATRRGLAPIECPTLGARLPPAMHPTKISPAIAALLTDEYLSGLSYRELERRHPGLSRSRIAMHVKRELQRRAQGEIEAKIERRAIARHRAQARAAAEANLPAGVRRKLAGQFYLHGEAGQLDERDFMGNLRAQRIKERGLHPVHASNFAVDCDDQEWADYLAGRDTWPPHVDASKATRRWKLGMSRRAGVSKR